MNHFPSLRALLLGALMLSVSACSSSRQFVHASADLSTIREVAVLPFDDVAGDKLGGERVQRIFLTELLALGVFDPVEPGQVLRAMRTQRVEPSSLTPEDIQKIGKELKVQGIFVGTLVEYEEGRGSQGAQVTLHLRLLDVESGKTVWSTSRSGSGSTVSGRLFGMGSRTAAEVAQALIREELELLVR